MHPARRSASVLAATFFLVATWLLPNPALAVGGEGPRVLLLGDSWAQFMWVNRTLETVFAEQGRPDLFEEGTGTAIGGTTAAQWADAFGLGAITFALDAQPTIDTVQLTAGGNDFLAGESGGGWFVGISPSAEQALFDQIVADVLTIVDHVLARGEQMEVVLSLYDYPNLEDTLTNGSCASLNSSLGSPTTRQLNDALLALQVELAAALETRERAFFVDHRGLMQFTYGFPDEGIAPGDLLPPGDPDRPSPVQALIDQVDCIHLSPEGYLVIGRNLWDGYYAERFEEGFFVDAFESGGLGLWSSAVP